MYWCYYCLPFHHVIVLHIRWAQKGWALNILKLGTSLFQERNHWVLFHEDVSIWFCGNYLIIDLEFMSCTRKLTTCFILTCNFCTSVSIHCASRKQWFNLKTLRLLLFPGVCWWPKKHHDQEKKLREILKIFPLMGLVCKTNKCYISIIIICLHTQLFVNFMCPQLKCERPM